MCQKKQYNIVGIERGIKMNIKKIKELRKVIKDAKPEALDMGDFFHSKKSGIKASKVEEFAKVGSLKKCDSAGCISGWTCLAFASPKEKKLKWFEFVNLIESESNKENGFFTRAKDLLGLTEIQAHRLFYGEFGGWGSIKAKDWKNIKEDSGLPSCGLEECSDCEPREGMYNKYDSKSEYTMNLSGEAGKKAILKQLDYMIKNGRV